MRRHAPDRGFSLLEMVIALGVSAAILMVVYSVLLATVKGDETIRARVELQLEATRTMQTLSTYLKTAGPVDPNGNGAWDDGEYPVFTEDGTAFPSMYSTFTDLNDVGTTGTNNSAVSSAATGDPDGYGGVSNEVIFRLPGDRDGDSHPTDSQGNIEWGNDALGTAAAYYALVIVRNSAFNWNELHLRRYSGEAFGTKLLSKQVLCTHLDRIRFESQGDPSTDVATGFCRTGTGTYDSNLGLYQLRITLWLWKKDINGKDVKLKQASTLNLRSVPR